MPSTIQLLICVTARIMYAGAEYFDEEDDAYIPRYITERLEKAFEEGGATAAKLFLSGTLDEWKQSRIHIGVTGNSGVGKSSFVNAIRGLTADDDDAAEVGDVETTMEPKLYQHPNNENMLLWDLPGVGTPNVLREDYLDKIQAQLYDYFIIISSGRFTENDKWIARELKNKNKRFYFVRSKITQDVDNDRKSHPKSHDPLKVLSTVRNDCMQNLRGYANDVYLVDTFETDKYDFSQLFYKLIVDAPELKKKAMLFTLNGRTKDIILAKKEALKKRIYYVAVASAVAGSIPVPGLDIAVDMAVLLNKAKFYRDQFGLTDKALERYAQQTGTSVKGLIESLALKSKLFTFTAEGLKAFMAKFGVQKAAQYIPINVLKYVLPGIGSIIGAGASYTTCSNTLEELLDLNVQDALKIANHFNKG